MKKSLLTTAIASLCLITLSSTTFADDACTAFNNAAKGSDGYLNLPPSGAIGDTFKLYSTKKTTNGGTKKIKFSYQYYSSPVPPTPPQLETGYIVASLRCSTTNSGKVAVISGQVQSNAIYPVNVDSNSSSFTSGNVLKVKTADIDPLNFNINLS